MQGCGELHRPGGRSGFPGLAVLDRQFDVETPATDPDAQFGDERMRPERACVFIVDQPQDGKRVLGPLLQPECTPLAVAGEAMLGQRTALVELREDHRNTASNRLPAVEHGFR